MHVSEWLLPARFKHANDKSITVDCGTVKPSDLHLHFLPLWACQSTWNLDSESPDWLEQLDLGPERMDWPSRLTQNGRRHAIEHVAPRGKSVCPACANLTS